MQLCPKPLQGALAKHMPQFCFLFADIYVTCRGPLHLETSPRNSNYPRMQVQADEYIG